VRKASPGSDTGFGIDSSAANDALIAKRSHHAREAHREIDHCNGKIEKWPDVNPETDSSEALPSEALRVQRSSSKSADHELNAFKSQYNQSKIDRWQKKCQKYSVFQNRQKEVFFSRFREFESRKEGRKGNLLDQRFLIAYGQKLWSSSRERSQPNLVIGANRGAILCLAILRSSFRCAGM